MSLEKFEHFVRIILVHLATIGLDENFAQATLFVENIENFMED